MQHTVIAGGPERNFETFDILHAFILLSVAKLSTLKKQSGFFGPVYIIEQPLERLPERHNVH